MESVFLNGGFIGKTFSFSDTDRYIIGETTGPAIVELVANTGRITATGASITLPAGIQPGDLVIVASCSDSTTPTYATGYTGGQQGRPGSTGYQWCYKFMGDPVDTTASGLTNITTTTHLAIAFRGVDSTTPLDVTPPAIASGGSGTLNPPAITTSTNNAVVVALGFLDDDLVASSAGAPSGYTFAAASQSSSAGATVMAAYKTKTPAGADDPGAFSGGDDDWTAATLALRPGTTTIPVFGNQKNSGIWDLQAVLEYRSQTISAVLSGEFITSSSTGNTSFTTRTFSGVSIGDADPNRTIAVTVSWNGGGDDRLISSATIGGISATIIQTTGAAGWERSAIIYATVTTGTTADIVINWNNTVGRGAAIGVFRLLNVTNVSAGDFDAHINTTTTYSTSVTTPSGNSYIISAFGTGNSVANWTNITERYTYTNSSDYLEGASIESTTAGTVNVSVTGSSYGVLTTVVFS